MSMWSTPRCDTASITAFWIAGVEPMVAASPMPFAPSGLFGDGVTVEVPLPLLGSLPARHLEWLVPGYLQDKLVALLRGLPKELRRELVSSPPARRDF